MIHGQKKHQIIFLCNESEEHCLTINILVRLTSCDIIGWPRNHRTCNPPSGMPPVCDSTPRVLWILSSSYRNHIARCILFVIVQIVPITSEISVWSEWCPPIYQHTAPSPPNLTKRDHHKALGITNNRKTHVQYIIYFLYFILHN